MYIQSESLLYLRNLSHSLLTTVYRAEILVFPSPARVRHLFTPSGQLSMTAVACLQHQLENLKLISPKHGYCSTPGTLCVKKCQDLRPSNLAAFVNKPCIQRVYT